MPTSEATFVDANVLIYAHDISAGTKHRIAAGLIEKFWEADPIFPAISVQVLQETYVNLIKKQVPSPTAEKLIRSYLDWNVIINDSGLLMEGIRLKDKLHLSFWDSLLVAAAHKAQVKYILTEDLTHNREYEGVKVINPFLSS